MSGFYKTLLNVSTTDYMKWGFDSLNTGISIKQRSFGD